MHKLRSNQSHTGGDIKVESVGHNAAGNAILLSIAKTLCVFSSCFCIAFLNALQKGALTRFSHHRLKKLASLDTTTSQLQTFK